MGVPKHQRTAAPFRVCREKLPALPIFTQVARVAGLLLTTTKKLENFLSAYSDFLRHRARGTTFTQKQEELRHGDSIDN
jgi:hypothetical protein